MRRTNWLTEGKKELFDYDIGQPDNSNREEGQKGGGKSGGGSLRLRLPSLLSNIQNPVCPRGGFIFSETATERLIWALNPNSNQFLFIVKLIMLNTLPIKLHWLDSLTFINDFLTLRHYKQGRKWLKSETMFDFCHFLPCLLCHWVRKSFMNVKESNQYH